jgi:hypothetical protein
MTLKDSKPLYLVFFHHSSLSITTIRLFIINAVDKACFNVQTTRRLSQTVRENCYFYQWHSFWMRAQPQAQNLAHYVGNMAVQTLPAQSGNSILLQGGVHQPTCTFVSKRKNGTTKNVQAHSHINRTEHWTNPCSDTQQQPKATVELWSTMRGPTYEFVHDRTYFHKFRARCARKQVMQQHSRNSPVSWQEEGDALWRLSVSHRYR